MVIAKTPVSGRVKTRLCPALTPEQACLVAWACLLDTLDVAAAVPASRHVLVLEGEPGDWIPDRFEVIAQRGDGLGDRLAAAFTDAHADGALVIAMDTPHVPTSFLVEGLHALADGSDAVMGLATDGGYWVIGLHSGTDFDAVFCGVPMSTSSTGAAQQASLDQLGYRTHHLAQLRDIDTIEDLLDVAAAMSTGRLPALVQDFSLS